MKISLIIVWFITLLLIPLGRNAYPEPAAAEAPPVAQALVREGDFAIKLVGTLKLGSVSSEAEAESTLASVGIAPRNGWIASYPMTPDILGELRDAVVDAADSGRLAMSKEEAIQAVQTLAAEEGLPVLSDARGSDTGKEPAKSYGQYSDPTVINNYYYNEGPPVVTYYPPPWDYYYMYSWVPHPFWWHSFFFSGFFILHDFHKVVVVKHKVVKVVTNHVFDPGVRKVAVVDPVTRTSGRRSGVQSDITRSRGFGSTEARRGAAAIVERSRERAGSGNVTAPVTGRGAVVGNPVNSGPGGRREGTALTNRGAGPAISSGRGGDVLRETGTDRRPERSRIEPGPGSMRSGSIDRPGNSGRQDGTNFNRFSGSGRNVFSAPPRINGRGFSSSSGDGSRSFSPPNVSSGRSGGMGFQRPSPRMAPSFSAPSIRAPSTSGRGSVQGFRGGGGGNSGRGGFARGGSSRGGGCRGRC